MGWLTDWAKRRKITIDNTNIDSDLTHFPIAVVLGTSVGQSTQDVSDIFDEVGANYLKIAFTKVDGTTQIYGDVELWDDPNEKAVIHVAKSDLDITTAAVTELYIYFDSAQANNTTYISLSGGTAAQSVWDSNFDNIFNMNQDPSIGGACILDSTSNNNNGTPSGMTSANLVDSGFEKAINFPVLSDKIVFGSIIVPASTSTIEMFIELTEVAGNHCVTLASSASIQVAGSINSPYLSNHMWFRDQVGSTVLETTAASPIGDDDTVHYLALTDDGTITKCYVDLADISLSTAGRLTNFKFDTLFSYNGGDSNTGKGIIACLRVSSSTRSVAWMKATKYTLKDDLLTFSSTEVISGGGSSLSDMALDIAAYSLKSENHKLDINAIAEIAQNLQTDIHVAAWVREDKKLDIAAYLQGVEDLMLDVSVLGEIVQDFPTDIHAAAWASKDKKLDIAAYFQEVEDLMLDVSVLGEIFQDLQTDIHAAAWASKDKKLDIATCAQLRESMALSVLAAIENTANNVVMDLWITDGDSLQDASLDIWITDGIKLQGVGLDIAVVGVMPVFKAVYAMHLDSAIKEII